MKINYSPQALKEIGGLKDVSAIKGVARAIGILEKAENLRSVQNVKSLSGGGGYFRMRIGNYRMGLRQNEEDDGGVTILRVLHRREIYRHFPPN